MGTETATGTGELRISNPPEGFREFFEYMGPAWVFTASQIGGGEALSVPLGGAYLGMEGLWLIPLVTFTKIFGQYYLVRYGVMSGDTFLDALFEQRWWMRWIFYYMMLGGIIYAIGLSGHLGETAGALNEMVGIGTPVWMLITVIAGLLIVMTKSYNLVEKISTVLLWAFLVLIAIVSLVTISWWGPRIDIAFTPGIPGAVEGLGVSGIAFILVIFGWIGAGFGPTVSYIWFAKDKVMGMFEPLDNDVEVSKQDLSAEEIENLKGWGDIVFWQNVISSVILFVFSWFMWTAAAATLYTRGIEPGGFTVVPQMATIFTSVYGEWSGILFLISVIFALFSTLIGPLYGMSRMWEDGFSLHGLFDKYDIERTTFFRAVVIFFVLIPLTLNLVIEAPLVLFSVSGILFAPAIGLMYLAVIYMSYTDVDLPALKPERTWAVALGVFAGIAMIFVGFFEVL